MHADRGPVSQFFQFCSSDDHQYAYLGPLYTRIKAHVQLKSSIPIGEKVEISPMGFTLGVKAKIEKNIFNFINKCWTFMAFYWPQG